MAASAAAAAGSLRIEYPEVYRMETFPATSRNNMSREFVPRTPQPTRLPNQPSESIAEESKLKTIGRSLQKSITDFFLGEEEDLKKYNNKWYNRSISLHGNKVVGGKLKHDAEINAARSIDTLDNSVFTNDEFVRAASATRRLPQPIDPLARSRRADSRSSRSSYGYGNALSRQYSHISTASSSRRATRPAPARKARKDSVFKMAYDGIKTLGKSEPKMTRKKVGSRSFAPGSISTFHDEVESLKITSPAIESLLSPDEYINDVFFDTPNPTSPRVDLFCNQNKPPLPYVPAKDVVDLPTIPERSRHSEIHEEAAVKAEDAGDAGDGVEPRTPLLEEDEDVLPEVRSAGYRKMGDEKLRPSPLTIPKARVVEDVAPQAPGIRVAVTVESDHTETSSRLITEKVPMRGWQSGRMKPQPLPGTPGYLLTPGLPDVTAADMTDGFQRFGEVLMHEIHDWDNSDRREVGRGFVGKLFDREYKKDLSPEIQEQIEAMDEHRPYFTYWATFIQVVIYIVAVAVYGIAPIGFEEKEVSGEILKPSLTIERVSYFEKQNFWIGPRQADLIHLGAKYSPCMRSDDNVNKAISEDRKEERNTACCVNNGGSGCIQSSRMACSETLATWKKWTVEDPGPDDRVSGSVCGQDPRFCKNPASSGAYKWSPDITEWPVCVDPIKASDKEENAHMNCQVVGRPCCVGIQGACIMTTREYCDFRRGYFHEEAALCSQVDCMEEICGMIPFRVPNKPDQFYRLWTSLFLHAGVLQLVVTILFQFFVMRDMEKLFGWIRTSIIYIGSGIAGSLASAIFLPYHVEAGPAGSQFGIIGCLFAELLQNYRLLENPWIALVKQGILLLFLFILGLLPYVDNYAHLFGLALGFLLAFALAPFIRFNDKCGRTRKAAGVITCLVIAVGLFALLTVLFYVIPIYDCPYCHYFNCIPFTPKFCKSMEVKIGREEIY